MFGLFKSKKSKEKEMAMELASFVSFPISRQMQQAPKPYMPLDDFSLGYVAGFTDGFLIEKGFAKQPRSQFEYLITHCVFSLLYGEESGSAMMKRFIENHEAKDGETLTGVADGMLDSNLFFKGEGKVLPYRLFEYFSESRKQKKNEDEATVIAHALSTMVGIQVQLCSAYAEKLAANFAIGYVAGMVEGYMRTKGLAQPVRSEFEYLVAAKTFMMVYGDDYGKVLFKRFMSLIDCEDKETEEGLCSGVNDAIKVMTKEGTKALGLLGYCHGLE